MIQKKKCKHCGRFNEYELLVFNVDETIKAQMITALEAALKYLKEAD